MKQATKAGLATFGITIVYLVVVSFAAIGAIHVSRSVRGNTSENQNEHCECPGDWLTPGGRALVLVCDEPGINCRWKEIE